MTVDGAVEGFMLIHVLLEAESLPALLLRVFSRDGQRARGSATFSFCVGR